MQLKRLLKNIQYNLKVYNSSEIVAIIINFSLNPSISEMLDLNLLFWLPHGTVVRVLPTRMSGFFDAFLRFVGAVKIERVTLQSHYSGLAKKVIHQP